MSQERPNIIYILADDLGYGDTSCYGATKITTPHIDALAKSGMKFTDCHSSSAVCTPTRYSILTGRYCWRTSLKKGVLKGFSPALIEKDRMTVASLLKQNGYATACIGKWHLGMGWKRDTDGNIDFAQEINPSPIDYGFDYYFGISGSLNMEPYCFIENRHTVGIPSVPKNPVHRGQNRNGLMVEDWRDELVNTQITERAVQYIEQQASEKHPFFMYLPLTGPHNPWVPSDKFKGKSNVGRRGDMILETDWTVGEIMNALDRTGITENTLVIFTSDNGPHSFDTDERAVYGHDQTAGLKGQKADIWEGGHRIPFIASWPKKIPAGTSSNMLVELTDFMATCADILGVSLPEDAAEDSRTIYKALVDPDLETPVRDFIISHSYHGLFSIRTKKWKYVEGKHCGGFHWKRRLENEPDVPPGQLYDMESDETEKVNLYEQHPDIVENLQSMLDEVRAE